MNNIELTEEHKSKLLEMCRELFPEYNRFIGFYKTEDELFYKEKIYKFNMLHLIGEDDNIQIIHWFEFCMTHLINKISEIEDSKLGDDDYDSIHVNIINLNRKKYDNLCKNILDSWSNKKHPIDYLYEEFKKLK